MEQITVNDIMITKITVAAPNHKFSEVMEFFNIFNIRHLPVTENNVLVGIISIKDILNILSDKLATGESCNIKQLDENYNAGKIMTLSPVTVTPETSLEEALTLLSTGGFHALPVVENNIIKGIITGHDMLMTYHKEKQAPTFFESDHPGYGI